MCVCVYVTEVTGPWARQEAGAANGGGEQFGNIAVEWLGLAFFTSGCLGEGGVDVNWSV